MRVKEIELTVRPFLMGAEKEAAVKVLEEAAETFGSWQQLKNCTLHSHDGCDGCIALLDICGYRRDLADEIADCIQACCNLAHRYGIDLQDAMERCEQRNRKRGRYDV